MSYRCHNHTSQPDYCYHCQINEWQVSLILEKISNDTSNSDHFVLIQISYQKKWSIPSPSVRPSKTQTSLGIHPDWSESSMCAQWVAKDPSFLRVDSEDSDRTGQMHRLIWVFAGHICHFVGFVMRRPIYYIEVIWHHFDIAFHKQIERHKKINFSTEYIGQVESFHTSVVCAQ